MTDPLFLAFLAQHDDAAWHRLVDRLRLAIHPVDRMATAIWLHFFPLQVQRAIEAAGDPDSAVEYLRIEGRWRLSEQQDASHWFLFGHHYWPWVREAVRGYASRPQAPGSLDLGSQIQEIARDVASQLRVDPAWLVGITAVAVRTLQQVGLPDGDRTPSHEVPSPGRGGLEHPDRIAARREADTSQGLFGFLRGRRRQWTVTFDEREPRQAFSLIHTQHLTTAAALDTRDYRSRDPRCTEGPIPVQCRSCSCGTCWVGVLGGAEKLSPMDDRERSTLASLGYSDGQGDHPAVRLACMAEARGSVTIVIPPWNGQVGTRLEKLRRGAEAR